MDLQKFIDGFDTVSCVMSVQVNSDGSYGNIRIVCGNKAYVDSVIKNNAEKAQYISTKTLRKVQKKVGFPERPR